MDHDESELLGFNDPTSISGAQANPTFFRAVMGIFLLTFFASFGASLWDAKWGKEQGTVSSYLFKPGAETKNQRWKWRPYRLEYELYYDRGYNLKWLELKAIQKCRETLGDFFSFFELFALRLWGALNFFIPTVIVFMFSVSMGSVRYYNKRFQFKHISSTYNNASIKVLFWAIPLTILWAMVPFGIEIPLIGELPILANIPFWGAFWVSSPGFGACVFGMLFSLVGFILGANFSREI